MNSRMKRKTTTTTRRSHYLLYRATITLLVLFDPASTSCMHNNNTSCEQCVSHFHCYWCEKTKHCGDKSTGRHFLGKIRQDCGGGEWFSYKQCLINGTFVSHIIYASSVIGVIIVVVLMGVLCFRAYKRRGYDHQADIVMPPTTYGTRSSSLVSSN